MHTFTPTRRLALALAALSACGTLYAQQSPPISIGPGNAPAPAAMSDNPATNATPGATDDSSQQAPLSVEDLDTLLAPVALYPDSLLSQVLMASTYPLEVVQANRWLQANATLTGDALADALNQQSWDPSVKSLVNTPSVLQMMDDKLDWTIRLGDAFLAQQADVMNSVQRLRAQAQQAGTLRSTAQQNITYENAYNDGATNPPVPQYIEIQETSPQYVYVPVYDPFVVYGNWRYRTHPWFWQPHNYVPTNGIWFGDRYTCGPAWGYAWGEPDWARHDLDLDPHRHSTLNPRFDSDRYIDQHYRHDRDNDGRNNNPRSGGDRGPGDRGAPNRDHRDDNNSRVTWRHDPTHRRGVAYPDATTAQRFGRPAQLPNAASPRLPNTVSPNLPNTVSPRLPNTVSPNLPNAASPRLPNASATPDADHRGSAPVRPQDPRRDLPIQNNPRDRNNGTPDNDANRPDRSNDDRSTPDRSTPDRPNGDHSNTDRPNTPTRGNAPDAGQPRDDRNVHPIRPSDRTTGDGNASDAPPAPVPPKPKPAPEPAPTPPTLPKPTPTQPPAPQDTPRRVVPQPTPPQPQVPQAPQPQVPQPAAPRREVPHDAPRHEAPAAPAPAAPTPAAPTPRAPTPDVPAAPARGGPHGSAGAPDAPAPAPAGPSNAPAAGPHGGR